MASLVDRETDRIASKCKFEHLGNDSSDNYVLHEGCGKCLRRRFGERTADLVLNTHYKQEEVYFRDPEVIATLSSAFRVIPLHIYKEFALGHSR